MTIRLDQQLKFLGTFFLVMLAVCLPELSLATDFQIEGGIGDADAALQQITDFFTGPIIIAVCTLAMIAAAAALLFGGEMSDLVRRIIMVVLAVAIIGAASTIISGILGETGSGGALL